MEVIVKEKKFCPECGKEIIGRADKTFCSNACRNNHNNKVNKDSTNLMRNINNSLRKNYKILSELNVGEKTKVSKKDLMKKKFNFGNFTSILEAKTGNTYYIVYDLAFQELEGDVFFITKIDF